MTVEHRVVELEIPARVEFVGLVRQMIGEVAGLAPGIDDGRLYDLKVAVSEACTNAVEAHRVDAVDEVIAVRCELAPGQLRVQIVDRGRGFDASSVRDLPPADDPKRLRFERGLGLPLIRLLADDVDIDSSADGTSVRVTMFLPTRS